MTRIKLSQEYITKGYSVIDNAFIEQFIPSLSGDSIKIYLYSIFLCHSMTGGNKGVEIIQTALNMDAGQLKASVDELKSYNLIRVVSYSPLEYEILPLNQITQNTKKYKPQKYADFSSQLQSLFLEKQLLPNDYLKYYELIEEYKIAPEAMIMIASYCIRIKTEMVHHNYILTVAKAWALEGATCVNDIETKLKEMELSSDEMRQIFFALGLKSAPELDDKQLLMKWTRSWGYELSAILETAKLCKKRGGMAKLDSMLDKFYRNGIFSLADIKTHDEHITRMRTLAIEVNKRLGVYYDNVDNIIETYIVDWLSKGYDDNSILGIASYCFMHNLRTLSSMNTVIDKFYKLGLLTLAAINQHIDLAIEQDKDIKKILEASGTLRNVSNNDRSCYNVWTNSWGLDSEILLYAASLSVGKSQPMIYINQILINWREKGFKTLAECKSDSPSITQSTPVSATFGGERKYTKEELDSIFGDNSTIDTLESIDF